MTDLVLSHRERIAFENGAAYYPNVPHTGGLRAVTGFGDDE